MEAAAARDGERDHHPLALLEGRLRTDLDHLAHIFVTENVAGAHRRDIFVVEVEIGAADRGRGDPDDRVAGVDDLGIGNAVDADVVAAVPGERAHADSPYRYCRVGCSDLRPDGPAELVTSPVSISCLKRRRSRRSLHLRFALQQLGDGAPERTGRRIVGDRGADISAAAGRGIDELDASSIVDVGAFLRLPGDQRARAGPR